MSLGSCAHCWDNPCTCGEEYKRWSDDQIYSHITQMIKILTIRNNQSLQPIVENIVAESHRENIW